LRQAQVVLGALKFGRRRVPAAVHVHPGRRLATKALAELLEQVTERPLHAFVATTNPASIRVLEKCGFVLSGHKTEFDEALGEEVEEALFELR
jgi:RimJ/RimL family protein N-acetyltransferase